MKFILLLLFNFVSLQTFAKSNQDCQELKSEQTRLALTASNLANINTTRTSEGGPYKPFIIKSCSKGGCDTNRDRAPLVKYLPNHPETGGF